MQRQSPGRRPFLRLLVPKKGKYYHFGGCCAKIWVICNGKKLQNMLKSNNLLGAFAQCVISNPQHFPDHECIEDGSPGQWHAKIEAKQPPVLYWFIQLLIKHDSQSALYRWHDAPLLLYHSMYKEGGLQGYLQEYVGIYWIKLWEVILEPLFVSLYTGKEKTHQTHADLLVLSCCVGWRVFHYLHERGGLYGM